MFDDVDRRRLLRRWFPLPTEADEPDLLLEALEATGKIPDDAVMEFARAVERVRLLGALGIISRDDPSATAASALLARAARLIEAGLETLGAGGADPRLEMPEDVREALIDDLEAGQPDLDGDAYLDETLELLKEFCRRLRRIAIETKGSAPAEFTPYLTGTDRPPAEIVGALFDISTSILGMPARGKASRRFVAAYARLLGFRVPSDNALRHRQRQR